MEWSDKEGDVVDAHVGAQQSFQQERFARINRRMRSRAKPRRYFTCIRPALSVFWCSGRI